MSARRRDLYPDLAALAFIWGVALVLTWPTTFGERALLPTDLYLRMQPWRAHAHEFDAPAQVSNPILDAMQQFYPWRLHASRQVRQGVIPLWTPLMLSGHPFVANNQSAIFYPETWLHYVIRPIKALGWATLMFFIIAGSTMYAFLRTIEVRPVAATVGGVTFMLCGFFVGWLMFPTARSTGAWLPLMLLGFERSVRRGQPAWLGLTALGTGMALLAGHLHIAIYVLVGFALYVIARVMGLALDGVRWSRLAGHATLAVGALMLGGMLAACQLTPTFELIGLSSRRPVSYPDLVHNGLALPQLLIGLMPDLFGNPVDVNHWGGDLNAWWGKASRPYTETAWYFGVAPLLLGIAGLMTRPRRQSWFWLGLLVFALLVAFGTVANLPLYYLLPGYRQLLGITRVAYLVGTAGAVLGALGMDALMCSEGRTARAVTATTVTALALLVAGLVGGMATWVFTGTLEAAGMPGDLGAYTLLQIGRFTALLLAAWALIAWGLRSGAARAWPGLALLVAIDLGVFMQHFTPEQPTEYLEVRPAVIAALEAEPDPKRITTVGPDFLNRLSPNTQMIFDLESMQGSESLVFLRYQRVLSASESERYGYPQPDPASPLVDMLAVTHLLSVDAIDDPGWRLLGRYETRLYANEQAAPRAFLARAVVAHPDDEAVFAAVTAPDLDPLSAHLAETTLPAGPLPHLGDVRVTDYRANAVRVEGRMPPGALLVLADVAYPGWRVWVDGRPGSIVTTNYVLRGVPLPEGARTVQFAFLPGSFTVGMFATLVALAALVGLGAAVLTGGRRA